MTALWILSPIAILISAGGSWYFASQAIESSKTIANRRATFDYITRLSWDKDYIAAKNTFLEIKAGSKKIRAVAEEYEAAKNGVGTKPTPKKLQEIIESHSAVKNILNEYEAMAIAVKKEVLDEEMMKRNIRQQFVAHVEACKDFIEYTRGQSGMKKPETLWCEIQALAKEWAKEDEI